MGHLARIPVLNLIRMTSARRLCDKTNLEQFISGQGTVAQRDRISIKYFFDDYKMEKIYNLASTGRWKV
jgi:hypothetical protein